jgi:hypothetical protein
MREEIGRFIGVANFAHLHICIIACNEVALVDI